MSLKIFAVYVNDDIFRSFFSLNPNVWQYQYFGIDNRTKKLGLPTIYNSIISENINEDCWLFFVHEDFEIKSDLSHILELDRDFIYGSFGIRLEGHAPVAYGQHTCSNKDGSNAVQAGLPICVPTSVQSLDCQSILIHTSLLRRHPSLRFDEALTFDLYAEDICMNAQFLCNIGIKVINFEFQHYSHGKVTNRYFDGLKHLAAKYPDKAIPGSCSFIGGKSKELEKRFRYDIQANSPQSP